MDNLEEYIKAERKRGFSIDSIKQSLINSGYDIAQIDEAIADLRHNLRHHMMFILITIVFLAIGAIVMMNLDTIREFEFESTMAFGEGAMRFSELDWEFSTINGFHFLEGGYAETSIQPTSQILQIGFSASGTHCDEPSMHVLTYEGKANSYNPLWERLQIIKGNVVRIQLSEEEREDAVASVGWPTLTIYIDGVYMAKKGIISPTPTDYAFTIDMLDNVGKDVKLRLAFENPCGIFDPETGDLTSREINILSGKLEFLD